MQEIYWPVILLVTVFIMILSNVSVAINVAFNVTMDVNGNIP